MVSKAQESIYTQCFLYFSSFLLSMQFPQISENTVLVFLTAKYFWRPSNLFNLTQSHSQIWISLPSFSSPDSILCSYVSKHLEHYILISSL